MPDSPNLSVEQTVVASNTFSNVQVSQPSTNRNGVATTVTEQMASKVSSQSVTSFPTAGSDPHRRQSTSSTCPINALAGYLKKPRSKPQKSKEQPSPNSSEDASKSKPWKFIAQRISSTKTKIQKTFFSNGEVVTKTQQQQTDSASVLVTNTIPETYRPADCQDKTEIDYLRRIQKEEAAAAALRNLASQDAELSADSDGERTTVSVHDTVMPGSQLPERAIEENEQLASDLAAAATNLAVTSGNLPTDTVSVVSEVLVNDDLVSRTGSLRVKTTRVMKMPSDPDYAETSGSGSVEEAPRRLPDINECMQSAIKKDKAKNAHRVAYKYLKNVSHLNLARQALRKAEDARKRSIEEDGANESSGSRCKRWKPDLLPIRSQDEAEAEEQYQPEAKSTTAESPKISIPKDQVPTFNPTLAPTKDNDDEKQCQPETLLPTPPESPDGPKSSVPKERVETEPLTPPGSPIDAISNNLDVSRVPSCENTIAILMEVEAQLLQLGLPPRSEVLVKVVKFSRERKAMGMKVMRRRETWRRG